MTLFLLEYQVLAKQFAKYPKIFVRSSDGALGRAPWIYPVLGLMGECGEFQEAISTRPCEDPLVISEAGDVLWYVAEIATSLESEIFPTNIGRPPPLEAVGVQMLGFAARIAERFKKQVRAQHLAMSDEFKMAVLGDLISILWCLASVTDLEQVARTNLLKLAARRDEGSLCALSREPPVEPAQD